MPKSFVALALASLMLGCAVDTEGPYVIPGSQASATPTVRVYQVGADYQYQLPDGTRGRGYDQLSTALETLQSAGTFDAGGQLDVVSEPLLDSSGPSVKPKGYMRVPKTRVSLSWGAKAWQCIGSCIGGCGPTLKARVTVEGTKKPAVDVHFIAFTRSGQLCVGAYNSGSVAPFCRAKCAHGGPPAGDVVGMMAAALAAGSVAAGAYAAEAWAAAQAAAPVLVLVAVP